mmetsp:Transcript_24339/g.56527  ORF Transcript_24339/g.56527 Transcript_24339/m.56527 type:complete len:1405 (+) Transcript_24339:157-4371(+)
MEGAKVYVQVSENWQKGTVVAALGSGRYKVQLEPWEGSDEKGGEVLEVDASKMEGGMLPFQNADMPEIGFPNMTTLDHLHEAALLHNLRVRFFSSGCPYTYTADIVIAVNPYRWYPELYTEEMRKEYLVFDKAKLAPHAYAASSAAFLGLQESKADQSILVSGESGAGKTETVKILMAHLALIASSNDPSHIKRIVESNPLLESFGNAQTVRNDNSSRFGKFLELQLDGKFKLTGSKCRTYLLEKSRVVGQDAGERNYHIFYQMLAVSEEQKSSFHLGGSEYTRDTMRYTRMGKSKTDKIEGLTDAERFKVTTDALALVGVEGEVLAQMLSGLAGILLLGQVDLEGGDEAKIASSSAEVADAAGKALQVEDYATLEHALTKSTITVRNESIVKALTPEGAANTRDALSKELYSRIFDWLVGRICRATTAAASDAKYFVGMLDIFGFESFAINRFEQLCINYANEKLQQKFTSDVFKAVQQEYSEEGIPWEKIEFKDNAPVLMLIESKLGVIAMLNEECVRPKGSEENFVSKLTTCSKEHASYSVPKVGKQKELQFTIQHYAGAVMYTATGWLERNKDTISDDVVSLMRTSENPIVASVFAAPEADGKPEGENAEKKVTKAGADTVATKFKSSLAQLMETIGKTSTQYVRCIKPNKNKSPAEVDNAMVVEQLRCAGVIEAIRISRAGFPARMPLGEFAQRFTILARSAAGKGCSFRSGSKQTVPSPEVSSKAIAALDASGDDVVAKCRAFMAVLAPGDLDKYEIGRTRVYFKAGVLELLEERRALLLQAAANCITRMARGIIARRKYALQRRLVLRLQSLWRMQKCRRSFVKQVRAIVFCQSCRRRVLAKRAFKERKRQFSATKLQSAWRGHIACRLLAKARNAAVRIQARFRCRVERRQYLANLAEHKEQAKLENQVKALQARLAAAESQSSTVSKEPPEEILEALQALAQENAKLRIELEKVKTENATLRHENQELRAGQSRRTDFMTWMRTTATVAKQGEQHAEDSHHTAHHSTNNGQNHQVPSQQQVGNATVTPPKRGVAEVASSALSSIASKRQSAQATLTDKFSSALAGAKKLNNNANYSFSTNSSPEKRQSDGDARGDAHQELQLFPPLNEFWEDVPCCEFPLLTSGSEVHIKFGPQILYLGENGKSLQWASWMMSSRGYRRSMTFTLERRCEQKAVTTRRGSMTDDEQPPPADDNSVGLAFALRSDLTQKYVVMGGLFDFYRMQVTADKPEEATVFTMVPVANTDDSIGAAAHAFAIKAMNENKMVALRKDGYVGMETVNDADSEIVNDRMAAAMEVLKPLSSYQITCHEAQVGIAVGKQLPVRVVGFNSVKGDGPHGQADAGPAERTGRVKIGDLITSVNGQDVSGMARSDIIGLIGTRRPVTLGFAIDRQLRDAM